MNIDEFHRFYGEKNTRPNELFTKLQNNNELTELQVMHDEMKTMPFADTWDEYCSRCGVKCDKEWFIDVKEYETVVLIHR